MRAPLAVLALSLSSACSPAYDTAATDTFTHAYACPIERQTIAHVAPPADVAADPQRRTLWESSRHIYDVSGCGKTERYQCAVIAGDAMNPVVDCSAYFAMFDPLAH